MHADPVLADFPHHVDEAVRFSETDLMGHVNNTVFGIYFEVGRSSFLSDQGLFRQEGGSFVIVKTEIQFLGMIHWPGRIQVGTRVTGAGRSSFTMDQLLQQDDRVVGRSTSTMVVIDPETNKATPMSSSIRALLGLA